MVQTLPPFALNFLEWLKKTDGRDKLYRLVAYGSKIPIHILTETGGDKDTIARLSKGAKAVGLSRKLMRMFRSLQFLQDFLQASILNDPFERVLTSIKAAALCIWMLVDHAQWFHKAGYIKLQNEKKLSEIHSKAWFIGLLLGAIISGHKLRKLWANAFPKDSTEFRKKEFKAAQGLIKNSTDLVIPAARLGWINVSEGIVGLAGTFTSIIGIYGKLELDQ